MVQKIQRVCHVFRRLNFAFTGHLCFVISQDGDGPASSDAVPAFGSLTLSSFRFGRAVRCLSGGVLEHIEHNKTHQLSKDESSMTSSLVEDFRFSNSFKVSTMLQRVCVFGIAPLKRVGVARLSGLLLFCMFLA